jgi:DNA-binding Lrp family transcriptional regulator
MPKNSIKQIEKDERRILGELLKNANKSINEIAKSLGFSRQKVWRIIKNLEKNKTIWGYVAVVNEEKLNKKSFLMLVKRTNKPITKDIINQIITRELANKVKKTGIEITNSFYTNGIYDWAIFFNADDLKSAKRFVEIFNALYKGSVSETDLLENMFSAVNCGTANPEIEKLKDFFRV